MSTLLLILKKIPLWLWPILALLVFDGVQTLRLHTAQKDLATTKVQSASYKTAQASQLKTIAALQVANNEWASKYNAALADAKFYSDAEMAYAAKEQTQASSAQQKIKVIYAKFPTVKAWADRSPPAIVVDQLRNNASR